MAASFNSGTRRLSFSSAISFQRPGTERNDLARVLVELGFLLAVCVIAIVIGAASAQP